jgi:hypothetical protein
MDTQPGKDAEANSSKQQAGSGDRRNDILQHEKLIDPGNEHSHDDDDEKKSGDDKEARFDAEAGDDKPGT